MKLQNLAVIFVILVLPILLMVSYNLSLQIDTLNMQTSYNTKLIDSTKEAVDAFEINTVEWNPSYLETSSLDRREIIMASINTFTTSLANNLGVAGTSKDYMISRIPAIVFTSYDGYYIYSPEETKVTIKDDKGIAVHMSEELCKTVAKDGTSLIKNYTYNSSASDKILYEVAEGKTSYTTYYGTDSEGKTGNIPFTLNPEDAKTETKHILKPFASYSEQLTENIVINYTLDNYITIYGEMEDGDEDGDGIQEIRYVSKSGYLTDVARFTKGPNTNFGRIKEGIGIKEIYFEGKKIEPEKLEEKIAYIDDSGNYQIGVFNYVYECKGNTKVYYDPVENKFFQLQSNLEKIYVEEIAEELYKKCTIPLDKSPIGSAGVKLTYIEVYQSLKNLDGKWYEKNDEGGYDLFTYAESLGLSTTDLVEDYSAVNYYVESYVVSKWVESALIPQLQDEDATKDYSFLVINSNNDPDPATNGNNNSEFENHKREVIQKVVEENLNQAITTYSKNGSGDFYLPKLTEQDWDQVLRNASIITFLQNVPIGTKYYNNYAIATSTFNKEYVDPNEIYVGSNNEKNYHMPYCKNLGTDHLIGFRSIDYVQKSYGPKDNLSYYYKHDTDSSIAKLNSTINSDVEGACYNCIVQKSLYGKEEDLAKLSKKEQAYYTALARERYIAKRAKLPAEIPNYAKITVKNVLIDDAGTELEQLNARFSIGGETPITAKYGELTIPKRKDKQKPQYVVKPEILDPIVTDSDTLKSDSFGSLNSPLGTTTEQKKYSIYESDSEATVNLINYDGYELNFNVEAKGNTDWGSGYLPDLYNFKDDIIYLDYDAYINVKLKYKRNYKESAASKEVKSVWANINDYNSLTIATKVKGVSGPVRLAFTHGTGATATTIYSQLLEIPDFNEYEIFCKIENDIKWYTGEWRVSVVAANYDPIISGGKEVEYYTIQDAKGLKAFAQATNGTAPSGSYARTSLTDTSGIEKSRKFYLINNIDAGEMEPIAQNISNWFNGYFSGGYSIGYDGNNLSYLYKTTNHVIKNVNIKITDKKDYAFGLFGWVGSPAQIEDLTIDNINVNFNKVNHDIKTGGLCGYADKGNIIQNITVQNSTIYGISYVGGLVGSCDKAIKDCNVKNTRIGNGDVTVNRTSSILFWEKEDTNKYCVGGLVGLKRIDGITGNCSVENCTINGGIVKYKLTYTNGTDEKAFVCAGGFIGALECNISVSNSFKTNNTNVSGFDNVGGIIGYNHSGTVSGITFKGTVIGSGENIGGIIGYNQGGSITNCTNEGSVKGTGEINDLMTYTRGNVGGIVGFNNKKNIVNCNNLREIEGKCNVGGIVGLSYGGKIESCKNSKTITGERNRNHIKLIGYETKSEYCTGTGGIAGKIYGSNVTMSGNTGEIKSNLNGGGIAGLNYGSLIEYSYNSGKVSAKDLGILYFNANRIGGIIGAGNSVTINMCYNTGDIVGIRTASNLINGIGGIAGSCVDDAVFLHVGETEVIPENKYIGKIELPRVTLPTLEIGNTSNYFGYCYNSGGLSGNDALTGVRTNGIVGAVLWAPGAGQVTFESNYYRDNVENGAHLQVPLLPATIISSGLNRKDASELKQQLYKWATKSAGEGGLIVNIGSKDKHVYNTTAPVRVEKGFGFDGYGVLWWQLEPNYTRTIFHIYDSQGCPTINPTLYIDELDERPVNLDAKYDSGYECKVFGDAKKFDTYGYILMLENKKHTYRATADGYTGSGGAKEFTPNKENDIYDVYIGIRPEFIFAKENYDVGKPYVSNTPKIPEGEYYVIATGGGRSRTNKYYLHKRAVEEVVRLL